MFKLVLFCLIALLVSAMTACGDEKVPATIEWGTVGKLESPRTSPTSTSIPRRENTKIAFSSYRDGNHEIYVMNSDGSEQTRLTINETDDSSPSWSK